MSSKKGMREVDKNNFARMFIPMWKQSNLSTIESLLHNCGENIRRNTRKG